MSRDITIESARPTARKRQPAPSSRQARRAPKTAPVGSKIGAAVAAVATTSPSDVRQRASELVARHRAAAIALLAAVVAVFALYGPVREYYAAWRTNGILQAQSEQISEESAELEGDISSLMTEDGIKDEARRRGYVEDGETRIVVEGLDEEDGSEAAPEAEAATDTPWYLALGDFIFQYDGAQ